MSKFGSAAARARTNKEPWVMIMSEHLLTPQIEGYRQRTLSPAELLAADDHLAVCEACRHKLSREGQLQRAFTAVRTDLSAEPGHLPYEQLAAYVDRSLSETDREMVESHLELCRRCADEVRDLREFAGAFAASFAREYAPSAAHAPKKGKALADAPGVWDKLRALWQVIPLQLAAAAAVVMLVAWLATLPLRSKVADLQAQVNQLQRENEGLRQDYQQAKNTAADLQAQLTQLKQSQTPDSSAQLLLALNDGGGQVTLDREGRLGGVESLTPAYQQMVKRVLTAQRIDVSPAVADLVGKAGTLMGGSGEGVSFALLTPVGTAVQSDRPVFRWRSLSGASSYVVKIYDADFNEVAASQPLTETTWAASAALARGREYSWQVTAQVAGREIASPSPPAPEARFKVLEQAKADELARARQTYASSHLTLGILYAQTGLLDDAEREFQALLVANPKASVAQRLLRQVQSLRRSK